MANADFRLDVGEGPAPGAHLHHHVEFLGREGHAPGDLSIRQLLAVRCPAGIGGDIGLLRGGQFLALCPATRGAGGWDCCPGGGCGKGVAGGRWCQPCVPRCADEALAAGCGRCGMCCGCRCPEWSRSWSGAFRFGSSALLPARRRDRGVQAERGFAGTRNATKLTALQGNFVCRFGWKPLGAR